MKLKIKLIAALALATVGLAGASIAGPGPQDYQHHIRTLAEAKKLAPATKVAFACTACKTFKLIEERKSFLSFFAPDQTHGCDGCGGKVTMHDVPGGKVPAIAEFTHVCTKCGDKSAYTCASHKG